MGANPLSNKYNSGSNHRNASKNGKSMTTGSLVDQLLLSALLFLSIFYVFILARTIHNLPPVPSLGIVGPSMNRQMQEFPPQTRTEKTFDLRDLGKNTPFPISIRDETFETIPHPAASLIHPDSQLKNPLPPLSVPAFWDPKEFKDSNGHDGIRSYLGNYGARLMTREEATTIGSFYHDNESSTISLPTIFMAIASYRDFQCPQTIRSLFLRAKFPQRVRVAVVDQYDYQQDTPCSQSLFPRPCSMEPSQTMCQYFHQIDFYSMDAQYAVGPVFARHLGHRMYRGEYFAGQIDAHVDFVQDWDVDIVGQWTAAKNEMAVLTTYLSDVDGSIDPVTFHSLRHSRPIMCDSDYEGGGLGKHLRHGQQPEGEPRIKGEPTVHPFWAAGFSFARGHFVVNVPYDQYLPMIFQGEETNIGLRGFSYGYDFYAPERSICFHYYAHGEEGKNKGARMKVNMFWEHENLYRGVEVKAMQRLNGIIHVRKNMEGKVWDHTDEKKYGIGQARDLQLYFDVFGIHTEEETVEQHLCQFVGFNMHTIWKKHLRSNGMGVNYDEIEFRFKDPEKYGQTWKKYL